ncbi:MAG: hypothetical protein JW888_02775 [Pirellulales bacterium]|nr:hypothetical protein [Pirellulales bacterium]
MRLLSRHDLLRLLLLFGLGVWLGDGTAVAEPLPARHEQAATSPSEASPSSDSPSSPAAAAEPKKRKADKSYLRLQCDAQQRPTAMEVAIVRFQPADRSRRGPVVDLIGAVHVAEPSFFAQLNREFAKYDAVLYELVAPENTRPVQGRGSSGSPVSALQTGLTQLLDLQFQLEGIDYQRPNMVHADMSPEEFSKSMRDRGESVWTIFMKMVGYSMMKQAEDPSGKSDMELLMALFDKNRALALKRAMAKQFQDMGGAMLVLDGPNGSTLVSERNKKALLVLRRELKSGKRKVAIFYGAGHMADMAKRLQNDFGLKPTGTRWLLAWDMSEGKSKKAAKSRRKP